MPFHQMDVDGFKSNLSLPVVRPIRANGNQLHMQLRIVELLGVCISQKSWNMLKIFPVSPQVMLVVC